MSKQEADCILIGGSTKGPVHVGALKEFVNYFSIARIAGSSAGSLWGAMMATGMTIEEIEDFTLNSNFKDLVKIRAIDYLTSYFKMHLVSTDKLIKFLDATYKEKTMSQCDVPFYVFVTNASKKRLELIGPENYPDMKVSEAVRISVSIPGVFEIQEMNGDYYWDGGMGPVIPLDVFSKVRRSNCFGAPEGSSRKTLVSMIADDEVKIGREENLFQRIASTIGVFIDSNFKVMLGNATPNQIIAQSHGLGLSMTQFDIDRKTKEALIAEGTYAAEKALLKSNIVSAE